LVSGSGCESVLRERFWRPLPLTERHSALGGFFAAAFLVAPVFLAAFFVPPAFLAAAAFFGAAA
jgi:hypothetical protein